jgi:hypothetical protein
VDYSHVNIVKAEVGRACCEFWLGRCMERDIQLQMPTDTWLLSTSTKNRMYGYDTQSLSAEFDGQGMCTIHYKNKPAPTAEEIETDYCHHKLTKQEWLTTKDCAA